MQRASSYDNIHPTSPSTGLFRQSVQQRPSLLNDIVSAQLGAQSPGLSITLNRHVAALASGTVETNPVEVMHDGFRCTLAFLGEPTDTTRLFHLVVTQEPAATNGPALTLTFVAGRDGSTGIAAQGEICNGRWTGLDLSGLTLPGIGLRSMKVEACKLDGARLTDARISHTQFEGVHAKGVDLSGTFFEGGGWRHCSIGSARMVDTTWSACTFERWLMSDNHLSRAHFRNCTCLGWVATACQWQGARFSACVVDTTSSLPPEATPTCLRRRSDLMVAGDTVIVSRLAPGFMKGFCDAAASLGIRMFTVEGGSMWVRDTQFKARLHGPGPAFHVMVLERESMGSLIPGDPLLRSHRLHSSNVRPTGPTPAEPIKSILAEGTPESPTHVLAPSGINVPIGAAFTLSSDRFIEGGNLIVIDERLALVGNDTLLHPADLPEGALPPTPEHRQKADRAYPGLDTPDARWAIWNQRKRAKSELTRLLGVESILLLPQWAFHIDLQLAFIGPRKVLVHSFRATLAFLSSASNELQGSLGASKFNALVAGNEAMARQWEESAVTSVIDKLRRAGVDAQPVCGMLAESVDDRGVPLHLCSLLVNGLGVNRESGKNPVFLTAGSPNLTVHEAHFRDVCRSMGVDVMYCYSEDTWGDSDPQSFIARQHGGVRCLSNTNTLGWLDFAFDVLTEEAPARN